MLCPECERRRIAEGHDTCYPCHIRGIGFTFRGSGTYGRSTFHNSTIRERQREAVSTNPNVERV
jgi:hypothetical protein